MKKLNAVIYQILVTVLFTIFSASFVLAQQGSQLPEVDIKLSELSKTGKLLAVYATNETDSGVKGLVDTNGDGKPDIKIPILKAVDDVDDIIQGKDNELFVKTAVGELYIVDLLGKKDTIFFDGVIGSGFVSFAPMYVFKNHIFIGSAKRVASYTRSKDQKKLSLPESGQISNGINLFFPVAFAINNSETGLFVINTSKTQNNVQTLQFANLDSNGKASKGLTTIGDLRGAVALTTDQNDSLYIAMTSEENGDSLVRIDNLLTKPSGGFLFYEPTFHFIRSAKTAVAVQKDGSKIYAPAWFDNGYGLLQLILDKSGNTVTDRSFILTENSMVSAICTIDIK